MCHCGRVYEAIEALGGTETKNPDRTRAAVSRSISSTAYNPKYGRITECPTSPWKPSLSMPAVEPSQNNYFEEKAQVRRGSRYYLVIAVDETKDRHSFYLRLLVFQQSFCTSLRYCVWLLLSYDRSPGLIRMFRSGAAVLRAQTRFSVDS